MKMKMIVLSAALLMTAFGASGIANAGGHWVCKPGGGQGLSRDGCWYKDDSVEYRGKSDAQSADEILKDVRAKAEKEAAKLNGEKLVAETNKARIAADIALERANAFDARITRVKADNEKSGMKTRGHHHTVDVYCDHRDSSKSSSSSAYYPMRNTVPQRTPHLDVFRVNKYLKY